MYSVDQVYENQKQRIAELEAKIAAYERTDMLGLQAKVERLADALRKISDIAETGNMEWVIDTAEAALEGE